MRITLILASCAILWTAGVTAAVEDDHTPQVRENRAKADCARWATENKIAADKREAYIKNCQANHLAMSKPEAKKAGGGED